MAALSNFIVLLLLVAVYGNSMRHTDSEVAELQEYIENKKTEMNQRYRLQYHVAGPIGWINDPNGFVYYKGEYHLFFQFYPYDSVWGPMHWGHVSSPDLVHWQYLPTALIPEEEMCFSGGGIVVEDTLVLMYTGRLTTEEDPYFNETQYLAFSFDGVNFNKYEGNPVLVGGDEVTPDFRDPYIWKHGLYYYVVIGSKTVDERGRVLLYRSEDLTKWEFLTVLGESKGDMGYMWECPSLFELDGKFVFLMSPQGLEPQGDRYKNIHQTGYIIGSFNYDTFEFVAEEEFQEIDFGHDFYAATTTEKDGKRYLVAWFNTWEKLHPEAVDGWAGALTIIRELRLTEDNRIIQSPVDGMVSLRDEIVKVGEFVSNEQIIFGKTAEIITEGSLETKIELQIEGVSGGDTVWLRWEPEVGKVVVDRGSDDVRQVEWVPISSTSWRIFLDSSSLELFCGEGEVVFSSRVYPDGGWKVTNLSPQTLNIEAYSLQRGIPE